MPPVIRIRQATIADHKVIVAIAKQSKYTKDYSNMIFSGEDCYDSGRIRVAIMGKVICGFSCFRHRKRNPATVLYFLGVDKDWRRKGIGRLLIADLWKVSIGIVEFKVAVDNDNAKRFYNQQGFIVVKSDAKYWTMKGEVAQQKAPR